MSLQYFEGFNTMISVDLGLDGGGDQDTQPEWGNGATHRHGFTPGPVDQAQAIIVNEAMSMGFAPSLPHAGLTEYTRVIVGGWFKLNPTGEGSTFPTLINIGQVDVSEATAVNAVYLRVVSGLGVQLRHNQSNVGAPILGVSTSGWTHFELDVNSNTGEVRVKRNGILVQTATLTMAVFTQPSHAVVIGRQTTGLQLLNYFVMVDSLYITSTPFTGDYDILGVSISASHDRYTPFGVSALYGKMIIEGVHYDTASRISNINSGSYGNYNVASTLHYKYYTNPATNQPWTENDLTKVNQWGVCCDPDGNNSELRLVCLSFNILRWNNGQPIVYQTAPGPTAYFDGPWRKSDPELSYFAHVNKHPRPNDLMAEDVPALFIGDEGCMLFGLGTPINPPIETIGISFAEEYRTDYLDWVRVDGEGQDFDSFFVSGYSLFGQGDKRFMNNYMTINYENVDDGSAFAQAVWDYAENNNTARWSQRQRVYGPVSFTSGDFKHGIRKLVMRGNGRSFQARISSEKGKPFRINGWTLYITQNGAV